MGLDGRLALDADGAGQLVETGVRKLRSVNPHVEAEHTLRVVDDLDPNLATDLLDHFEEAFEGDRLDSLAPAPSAVLVYESLHLDPLSIGGRYPLPNEGFDASQGWRRLGPIPPR